MRGQNRYFILFILLCLIFCKPHKKIVCNPIPSDQNFETSPVPSQASNLIYFNKERINITFTSSTAYLKCFYSFKNTNETPVTLNILLPFSWYPQNLSLIVNHSELTYSWRNVSLESIMDYYTKCKAIEFQLSFEGFEEKEIQVQYSREYMNQGGGGFGSDRKHYNFRYLVGTASAWNYPIDSAYFEFWIPKSICDNIKLENFHNFNEKAEYYVGSLEYEEWVPENDFVSISWTERYDMIPTVYFILFIMGFPILIAFIIIPLVFIFKRKRKVLVVTDQ